MKEPDAELIDRAKGGDAAAFSSLILRYQGLVHAAAFQWSGDRAAAQDIAQETFVAAFTRLGELLNPRSFPAWLYRIARNKAAGWRRALARRTSIEAGEDLAAPPEPSASESTAEQREAAAFGRRRRLTAGAGAPRPGPRPGPGPRPPSARAGRRPRSRRQGAPPPPLSA